MIKNSVFLVFAMLILACKIEDELHVKHVVSADSTPIQPGDFVPYTSTDIDFHYQELISFLAPRSVCINGAHFDHRFRRVILHSSAYMKTNATSILLSCLLQCGDIQSNPGPATNESSTKKTRQPRHPCMRCGRGVIASSKVVTCGNCDRKLQVKCTGITSPNIDSVIYTCDSCLFL